MKIEKDSSKHLIGCILGTAVGDAIGLPYEGLSRRRMSRLFGAPDRHRFLLRRGMVSDDTEHTCIVAQACVESGWDVEIFRTSLARRFRYWLLGIPAGIGMATLKSIVRLWLGISSNRSGVASAGNGPAMRAAILGVAIRDRSLLREFVHASSAITHKDPKAEYGAFAVALAAQMASNSMDVAPGYFLSGLKASLNGEGTELLSLISDATESVLEGKSTMDFADSLDLHEGVSGYVYHTVPVAIHAWLSNTNDFRTAIMEVIRCGGDTDSTAAIVGGIVGAGVGRSGIPKEWLDGISEWPRSVQWMETLGQQLYTSTTSGKPQQPIGLSVFGLFIRNLFFMQVVLLHAFRRLLPPY